MTHVIVDDNGVLNIRALVADTTELQQLIDRLTLHQTDGFFTKEKTDDRRSSDSVHSAGSPAALPDYPRRD